MAPHIRDRGNISHPACFKYERACVPPSLLAVPLTALFSPYSCSLLELVGAAGERCLSVNLAKLPNADSFFGYEEEEIATALGSVCHVLFLVSKYLDVRQPPPPPLPLRPCVSLHVGLNVSCWLCAGATALSHSPHVLAICHLGRDLHQWNLHVRRSTHLVCLSFIGLFVVSPFHDSSPYRTLENTRSTLVASIKRALTSASSSSTRTWNRFVLTPTAATAV